ncbi:MAG: lauroyl acyltransferase [Desulfobacterales bacterium]|nr:lauroyl acyltransferase [Desulfobacterales bacterium]
MQALFYQFLVFISQRWSIVFFILFSKLIAAGYFFLFPYRVSVSVHFYRSVFPKRSDWFYLWCTWKQYQHFTSVFLDRFLIMRHIRYTSQGKKALEDALIDKTGAIILMSHLGNWEVAAQLLNHSLLKDKTIPMLLYMGKQHHEQIEQIQKLDLIQSNIQIVDIDPNDSSPFNIIDGLHVLKSGGIVSLTGDMVWHEDQRTICVEFLGHEVVLPQTPYILALLSGSPLFLFFTFKKGNHFYQFILTKPIHLRVLNRKARADIIRKSAQQYADYLKQMLLQHPFEWYHFKPFLGKKIVTKGDILSNDEGRN